jgi:anti-sigma regulatory factor (Ser/Thr protein kinase)
VAIEVRASATGVCVRITNQGGAVPSAPPEVPDLRAKLAGRQTPRGWGLYLIEHLVDEVRVIDGEAPHTIELTMYRGA